MSLLSKVTRCMRAIAPLELAETSWDNVGVLVGKKKIRNLILTRFQHWHIPFFCRTSFSFTKTKQSIFND